MTNQNLPPQPVNGPGLEGAPGPGDVRTGPVDQTEMLREGVVLLSEDVGRVLEESGGDPKEVSKYFDDVLADTEGKVPQAERLAVFQIVAGEQRSELHERSLEAGKGLMEGLGADTQAAGSNIQASGTLVRQRLGQLFQAHESVRSPLNRGDVRGADNRAGEAVQMAGGIRQHLEGHVAQVGQWQHRQGARLAEFGKDTKPIKDHLRALDEASRTLRPDHEGEPKDISGVVDEGPRDKAASRMKDALIRAQEENLKPEEAVLEMLGDDSGKASERAATDLFRFTDEYGRTLHTEFNRIRSTAGETDQRLQAFRQRGSDGYRYVKRVEEAVNLYKQQQRALEEGVKGGDFVSRRSIALLSGATAEQRTMLEKLQAASRR